MQRISVTYRIEMLRNWLILLQLGNLDIWFMLFCIVGLERLLLASYFISWWINALEMNKLQIALFNIWW